MENNQIKNTLGVMPGEITVLCGKDIMSNTEAGFRKSLELIDSGKFKKVLYLNCGPTLRNALQTARQVSPDRISANGDAPVHVMKIDRGYLCYEVSTIARIVKEEGYTAIVINSWEISSANSRHREALLYGLLHIADKTNASIIIYSQAKIEDYTPGSIMRGTLGKLSAVASFLFPVSSVEVSASSTEQTLSPSAGELPSPVGRTPSLPVKAQKNTDGLKHTLRESNVSVPLNLVPPNISPLHQIPDNIPVHLPYSLIRSKVEKEAVPLLEYEFAEAA